MYRRSSEDYDLSSRPTKLTIHNIRESRGIEDRIGHEHHRIVCAAEILTGKSYSVTETPELSTRRHSHSFSFFLSPFEVHSMETCTFTSLEFR